jgi:hypothetical protein
MANAQLDSCASACCSHASGAPICDGRLREAGMTKARATVLSRRGESGSHKTDSTPPLHSVGCLPTKPSQAQSGGPMMPTPCAMGGPIGASRPSSPQPPHAARRTRPVDAHTAVECHRTAIRSPQELAAHHLTLRLPGQQLPRRNRCRCRCRRAVQTSLQLDVINPI